MESTAPTTSDALLGAAVADGSMSLVYAGDKGLPCVFELGERARVVLGRDAACDLVFKDQRVSRRHALVELVESHRFLRDLGSSNGTFLNGLRIGAGNAFSLREGDVIEVGNERIVYARGASQVLGDAPEEIEGSSYPAADLVRDGYQELDLKERTELQVTIQKAFDGVPRPAGIDRSLAAVADWIGADTVALFSEDASKSLRAIAVRPRLEAAASLATLATRAWTSHEGKLHFARGPSEAIRVGETAVHGEHSAAAAPFIRGAGNGVLVVERSGGKRLHRSDLALLAVMAERISLTLALRASKNGDTRVG